MIITAKSQMNRLQSLHASRFTAGAGTFTQSGNELTCTAPGTTYIPLKFAHGTWEFDVLKGNDANTCNIDIISSAKTQFNGYRLIFGNNESIYLDKYASAVFGGRLFNTVIPYIANNTWYRIKIARLQSEGVFKDIPTLQTSDLINGTSYPYESFTAKGKYGFSASTTTSGIFLASTGAINININAKYLVEFDLKLNSGTAPTLEFRNGQTGSSHSNFVVPVNGRNSIILTATATSSSVLRFFNTKATDYEVSGLTIRRIYDADTFAVFIKGGAFGDDYTLVNTTGGAGTNPVTDATHTTSNYFVADLDAGDKIANVTFKAFI